MRTLLVIVHGIVIAIFGLISFISLTEGQGASAALGAIFLLAAVLLAVDLFLFVVPFDGKTARSLFGLDTADTMAYEPSYQSAPPRVTVQPTQEQPATVQSNGVQVDNTPINASVGIHMTNDPGANRARRACPKCNSQNLFYQTVSERKSTGCLTILLYIFLAVSVVGWVILIPLLLRNPYKNATYAVCQNCGHRFRVKQ